MSVVQGPFAQRIADRVNRDYGERVCGMEDVINVAEGGSLAGREAVESRILQELEEYGIS